MTYVEKIKQAKSPREAILILADGLDALDAVTKRCAERMVTDSWDSWASPEEAYEAESSHEYDRVAALEHARLRLQHAKDDGDEDEIKAAQASLWLAENPGSPPPEADQGRRELVTIGSDSVTVEVPVVDAERKQARYEWAKARNIGDVIGLDNEDAARAYSKGGGLWLYHAAHKVVTENFPRDWRVDLINDVALDSHSASHEIGRDLLKADAESTKSAPAHAAGDIG